jgi:hypothetical protein
MVHFKNLIRKIPILHNYQKTIRNKMNLLSIKNSNQLVDNHFKFLAKQGFQNTELFKVLFKEQNQLLLNIFETGSSANWGANSSLLFDTYVKKFGGEFVTVDLRSESKKYLDKKFSKLSRSFVDDSLNFIDSFDQNFFQNVGIVYLDSYDLDVNNPYPSMEHGLAEFLKLDKNLKKNCLVAIDDTPNREGFNKYLLHLANSKDILKDNDVIPGKGSLILNNKIMTNYELIYHHYGVILKKIK